MKSQEWENIAEGRDGWRRLAERADELIDVAPTQQGTFFVSSWYVIIIHM